MKRVMEDLALFGGDPAFRRPLHVGRPNLGNRKKFLGRVNDILDRRWLSNGGPYVREFEGRVAEEAGTRHCVAMSSGTTALEIAIRGLGLSGEVILPSFTFVATAHALQWQEITPVFCDINPETWTLDPGKVEELITPRTTGILGVHLWGNSCAADALQEIADRRHLKLLFDAAHAFGSTHEGRSIGQLGNASVFSFHPTKFIGALEGGAVVTDDDHLAAKLRLMKNFGFAGYDEVVYLGTNGKMNEVSAAMGLTNLEEMAGFLRQNRKLFACYQENLSSLEGVSLREYPAGESGNFQSVILDVDEKKAGISRDELLQILHAENILARRYFYPGCHRMEPYRSLFPEVGGRLPETEKVSLRVLCLPTGTALKTRDVEKVCEVVRWAVQNSKKIRGGIEVA